MAGMTGLEPATFGVTSRHSNQLSYTPFLHKGTSPSLSPHGRPVKSGNHQKKAEDSRAQRPHTAKSHKHNAWGLGA